jgi:hypothetical protein
MEIKFKKMNKKSRINYNLIAWYKTKINQNRI